MSLRARRFTVLLVVVVVVSVVAGALAWRPLERALFLATARRATGLEIDVASLARRDGLYELTGLHASTPDGSVTIDVPHASVRLRKPQLAVVLERPHVVLDAGRLRGDEATRAMERLRAWLGASAFGRLTVRDGALSVASTSAPQRLLEFDALSGELRANATHATYDFAVDLVDGPDRYPLAAHSSTDAAGSRTETWTAALLPVAPFAAFVDPAATTRATAGRLRDVTLVQGKTVRANLRLDGVALTLDSHVLGGLHGRLSLDAAGAGSSGISGTLDGAVPFEASGEVHDLGACCAWLRAGSRDLQSLVRLTSSLASEPKLSSVRVEATAPGLAYGQYGIVTEHGPLAITVLAIDPQEPTLRFDTAIAEDRIVSGGERTSAMGLRTKAIAGVNGDYFDIGRTYQPQGMLVRGGKLLRGPTDRAVLAVDAAKHVTFGEFHLSGALVTREGTMPVTEFNDWPPGQVAVMTPDFGKSLRPSSRATFVALAPVDASGKRFRVADVVRPGDAVPSTFGVAIGSLVHVAPPRVGEVVELTYRTQPALDGVVAAIGGGPILLRDGEWYEDPHAPAPEERDVRWPVVALARQTDDRLLLVAVDGRHPERSVGATRPEFAELLRRLGAVDAMALDSGGSVTVVARKPGDANVSVRNVVSDFSAERWISDALFLYSSAPVPTLVPVEAAPTPVPEARPTP